MTFDEWRRAFEQATRVDDRYRAQLWNHDHETRIDATRDEFRGRIATHFDDGLLTGDAETAALAAWTAARNETGPADSKWLGTLPCDSREDVGSPICNFRSGVSLERYRTRAPSYSLVMTTSAEMEFRLNISRRFVWITWAPGSLDLPDAPTLLKRELGLAHFGEHDCVYRWIVSIKPSQVMFVPTCLDANLSEAWRPPPPGHTSPWGLTRDLTTGESRWPELLLETKDYKDLTLKATRVGSATSPARIGPVTEDYMIGRL